MNRRKFFAQVVALLMGIKPTYSGTLITLDIVYQDFPSQLRLG